MVYTLLNLATKRIKLDILLDTFLDGLYTTPQPSKQHIKLEIYF